MIDGAFESQKRQRWTLDEAERSPTPFTLQPARSEIYFEPRGQVLILSPWNYPFNLSMIPLIEAVAAGNGQIGKKVMAAAAQNLAGNSSLFRKYSAFGALYFRKRELLPKKPRG